MAMNVFDIPSQSVQTPSGKIIRMSYKLAEHEGKLYYPGDEETLNHGGDNWIQIADDKITPQDDGTVIVKLVPAAQVNSDQE